jgi:hypothetical protein
MKHLILKYAPPFLRKRLKKLFTYLYRRRIAKKNVEEVFAYIYHKKIWGNDKTRSGTGSNHENTKEIKKRLPQLLKKYNIATVLDVPCGDFSWMQQVNLDGVKYIGGDIVKSLIQKNVEQYANPHRSFYPINLIEDPLPEAELLICRDGFVHLSNEQVLRSLDNIKTSRIPYLLVTSFEKTEQNQDIIAGEWRKLNMRIAPFNLEPIEVINEKYIARDGKLSDKSLILVKL